PAARAGGRKPSGRPAVKLAAKKGPGEAAKPPAGGAAGAGAGADAKVADKRAADDPRFKKALDKVNKNAKSLKKHDPASKKAAEAAGAAVPPAKEKQAGAQAVKVEEMEAAEGKKPESASFLETLRAEIERAMPKTLGETDEFMDEDSQRKMKEGVSGNIDDQKEAATGEIKATTQAPPDTSQIPGKEVVAMPSNALPPDTTTPVGAKDAMPAKKTDADVSLQKSKDDTSRRMSEAKVTTEQLNKANDPRFSAVVKAKADVDKHADSAPKKYRTDEQKTLTSAAAQAVAVEQKNMAAMKGVHGKQGANVKSRQQLAKEKDEARRKEVADTIENIFNETKKKVEDKLASLETDVNSMFDRGVTTAMENMKKYVNQRKDAWKAKRYDRVGGSLLWAKDKLFGLPDDVKVFYEEGRKLFTKELDELIVKIADTVDARLKEAKDEISKGQKRIGEYVASLPKDLQAVGQAAEKEMTARFDELRQGVEDKKNDLASGLAQKYKDARDKADSALKDMQEADKGLVTALVEKLGEVVEILRNFKNRIMGMLKKAADTIDLIVADPIGFLKNLLAAVKKGINQFASNIWEHLKAGFMGWLFGALGSAGITVPKDFSLPSILKLVMDVLGITWPKIRAKVVKIVGERNMALIEAAAEAVKILIDGGPAALWEKIKEYLGNLKEMIMTAIQEWVVTSIIKAAVTKLVSMFNPAGAIIQAIIAIYNTVMFFIERINQILAFVEAVIESVHKIATGAIDSAANWIEQAMARTIPLIISFLARLLGLGGISEKIKGFILKVQTKVDQAIDKVIDKIVGGVKKLFAAGKAVAGKVVGKIAQWLGLRKEFTTPTGHRHTLFFRGEGASARLMLASDDPTTVEERIAAAQKADKKNAKKYTAALGEVAKIRAAIRTLHQTSADTAAGDGAAKVDKQMEGLKNILKDCNIDAKTPLTKVTFTLESGLAKTVKAWPLTKLSGNTVGSAPRGGTIAKATAHYHTFDLVQDPKNPKRQYPREWRAGHILSQHLHGPGEDFNLIPVREKDNGKMLRTWESDMKEEIPKSAGTFFFDATVTYHKGSGENKYLDYFPQSIKVRWGELSEEGANAYKESKIKYNDSITFDPPPKGKEELAKTFNLRLMSRQRFLDLKKAESLAISHNAVERVVAALDEKKSGATETALKEFYREQAVRKDASAAIKSRYSPADEKAAADLNDLKAVAKALKDKGYTVVVDFTYG
ncbi:MAG TPA: hypothetical protein VER32_08185, partial [Pyrinomonadaceae bacterium]|nr:hypothetical protein [Pyrinomonadaceae bacterium]